MGTKIGYKKKKSTKLQNLSFDCKVKSPLNDLRKITTNYVDRDKFINYINDQFKHDQSINEYTPKKEKHGNIFSDKKKNHDSTMFNYNIKRSRLSSYNEPQNIFSNEERKNSMTSTYYNTNKLLLNKATLAESRKIPYSNLQNSNIVIVKNNKIHKIPRDLFTAYAETGSEVDRKEVQRTFLQTKKIKSSKYDHSIFGFNKSLKL